MFSSVATDFGSWTIRQAREHETFNPWYTSGLFHCYTLDKSIYHFRGVGSILLLLFYF